MKRIFTLGMLLLAGAMTLPAQSPYNGSEPVSGDEYYLYNVETGLWIQGYTAIPGATRDRWNTAANVGDYGKSFKLESQDDGSWKLNTIVGNEIMGSNYGDGGLLYLDWEANRATWTLTGNAADGYKITSGDAVLGVGYETYNDIEYPVLVNNASENTLWQLVTADERRQFMANATVENPQDVSWLIVNPELMNNDHHEPQWSVTRVDGGESWPDGFKPNRVFETWNYSSFDFYQTLSVPNGKYELTAHALFSPTEGASTNYEDYLDYVERGAETVNGYLYANSESVKLPSIYSFTSPTPVPDYAAKALQDGGISIVDGWWQAARAMGEDDQFKTETITVTVTDGQLRLGVKETNNSGNSHWIIIGNFKLKYLGNDIDLSEYISNLEKTLAEAKAFNGNTTDILRQTLNSAIAAAEDALESSTDPEELSFVNTQLSSALSAAKDLDDTLLEAIVALAKAEGVNTADAEEFLAWGTDRSIMDIYVNDLRVARKVANMETDNATYEGNAPAEGEFYLYNVGRKAYLTNGSDWGAHAALGYPGLEATLATFNGGYSIQFNELVPGDARDKFLGGSPYCDCADVDKGSYEFIEVADRPGVYTIKGDRGYLAFDPNGEVDGGGILHYNTVTAMWAEPQNEDAYWMLVTKEERLAQMKNASDTNPVDVTVLIRDASFNKYAALNEPWIGLNQSFDWGYRDHADKNTEAFNTGEFELSQVIDVPEAGYYRVSVQAYYRDGSRDAHVESVLNGETLHEAPILFADLEETPLKYIHEEADMAPGEGFETAIGNIPDGMYQASKFFQNGLYWNDVIIKVDQPNSTLNIGIYKYGVDERLDNWIVADNFRIVYLGAKAPSAVEDIIEDKKVQEEGETLIYNLQGIRVVNPQNGLYIVNGKKVYIK